MVTKTSDKVKDSIKNVIKEYEKILKTTKGFVWKTRYYEGKIDGLELALEYIEEDDNGS